MALKVCTQGSMLTPTPPEPCIRTTTGSRPVPCAMRNSPATVTGLPLVSPLRNCWSEIVSEGMAWISTRAAASLRIDCALLSLQVMSRPVQTIAPAMARRQSVSMVSSPVWFPLEAALLA
jgi:hypothetical protein